MIIFTACFNGEPDGGDGGYNGSWEETTELRPDNYDTQGNFFGINTAVSSDGQMLLVGANGDSGTGKVYLYEWDSDTSDWAKSTLIASDIEDNDNYGGSVNDYAGFVYVYRNNSGSWEEEAILSPEDGGTAGDRYGFSCAVSDDETTIAVSSPSYVPSGDLVDVGCVYIYRFNSNLENKWEETDQLLASNGTLRDR